MPYHISKATLDNFIVIGDRVLIQPKGMQSKTKSGLFLPPGIEEKESIHSGYVVKVGPGYPMPSITELEEPWTKIKEPKYIPLQAMEGDLAVYLQKSGYEIQFDNKKYIVVPHSAILLLLRDEGLFE